MRIYIRLREIFLSNQDLLANMEELETKILGQDEKIDSIFSYLRRFVQEQETPRKKIGYKSEKVVENI